MAYRGKIIKNKRTRQAIQFVTTGKDSDGKMLEMVSTWQSLSREPEPHYHPAQDEYFTVIQGELTVKVGNEIRVMKEGDSFDIPKNTIHSMWNNSSGVTIANWKVCPALHTEYFLETATGLANDSKLHKRNMDGILQSALLAQHYSQVFRLAKPSYILQCIIFAFLTPLAALSGKKAVYKEYLD